MTSEHPFDKRFINVFCDFQKFKIPYFSLTLKVSRKVGIILKRENIQDAYRTKDKESKENNRVTAAVASITTENLKESFFFGQ